MENRYYTDIDRDRVIRSNIVLVIVLFLVSIAGIRLFHVTRAEHVVKKIPSAVVLNTEIRFGSEERVIVEFHTSETLQYEGGKLFDRGVHRAEVVNGKIVKVDDAPFP